MQNRIDVTVGDDIDYHYVVTAHPDGICLTCDQNGLMTSISFGSFQEMEHVAKAMLTVTKISKELS